MDTPSTPKTLEQRIEQVEGSLKQSERMARWVNVLSSVLVPLAIGLSGLLVSRAIAERDHRIKEIDARVAQAEVVTKLLEALAGENGPKKRLAIRAVLIALPEDGPDLVRDVAQEDPDPSIRRVANATLQDRAAGLLTDLFAGDAKVRTTAAAYLVSGWRSDAAIVPRLIEHANAHWENDNGVYNTVAVLADLSPSALTPHRRLLDGFLNRAAAKGEKTRAQVQRVRERLP